MDIGTRIACERAVCLAEFAIEIGERTGIEFPHIHFPINRQGGEPGTNISFRFGHHHAKLLWAL